MSSSVRAIRGATTVEQDEPSLVSDRVAEMVRAMFEENAIDTDDVISILFTATSDISSMFPATAARTLGLGDIPLMGAQELTVDGMLPRCIRALMHVNTDKRNSDLHHVFLHEAKRLRVDLVR